MLQVDRVVHRTKMDEGFRSEPYQCTSGVWTIGYGTTYYRGSPVNSRTHPLSLQEANVLLKADILDAIDACQYIYENFDDLYSTHQEVLVMLAYQLGRKGLMGFVKMNEAIRRFDMADAAKELEDSKLYTQATRRIDTYIATLTDDQWPE